MANTPIPTAVDSLTLSQEHVADAVHRLKQAAAQMQASPLWQEIVEPRDEVFARFKPIFATAHLPEMTEAEFSPFLYFEHNHHWTGLHRQVNRICGDMPLLRESLIALLDEARPIADRFDEVDEALHGIGKGIITAILTVAYPDRYGVWNSTSEAGLVDLQVFPTFARGATSGQKYTLVNELLTLLAKQSGLDLWTLDAVFWFLSRPNEVPRGASAKSAVPMTSRASEASARGEDASQKLRDQITREDLLDAISALDAGEPHQFGDSTIYDVVYDSRRYPPKAVVGLAARRVLGRPLRPDEFSGGKDQWSFRLLTQRGFTIVDKETAGALPEASSAHVWIEDTNTAEHAHGGEGWEFGTCLWSPSTFAGGSDSYALMREPTPDDLVIHIDNGVFVGWSRISAPYREVTQAPPLAGRWEGRPSYYRIDLKDYRKFPNPITTKDFVAQHQDSIRRELEAEEPPARYPFILYGTDKQVRKAQGAYLSRCTPPLYDLLKRATASETSSSNIGEGRFWAMSLGEGGRLWDESQEQGIASLGWDEADLGDLKEFASREAIQEALTARRGPGAPAPSNDALALYQFSQEMAVGDHIVVKAGRRRLLGVGQVTSEYYYDETRAEHRHCRRVHWLSAHRAELPVDLALPLKTLTEITHEGLIDFIQEQYFRTREMTVVSPSAYSIGQALDSLFMSGDMLRAILGALTRKKNVILQGPPGVGKSYAARRIAYALMEEEDPSRVEMVQFHQSYAYEDFVQGWRPKEEGGFRLRNGTFVEFCNRARIDGTRKYVFIIDEINRGNLSKILGELMLLIEADKRGAQHAIPLTYSESDGERFSVPENVYILGMMNTADRSLALVDYALRRRFVFFAIPPSLESENFATLLRGAGATQELVDTIRLRVGSLNQQIAADPDLGEGFSVGHSYFCPAAGDGAVGLDWYKTVIDTEVGPLLREYWFDKKQTEIEAIIFKLREGI